MRKKKLVKEKKIAEKVDKQHPTNLIMKRNQQAWYHIAWRGIKMIVQKDLKLLTPMSDQRENERLPKLIDRATENIIRKTYQFHK